MITSVCLLMSWTRCWMWHCVIACHSWRNVANYSAKYWPGGCLWCSRQSRPSHKFSNGMRSGLHASQGMVMIAFCCSKSITACVWRGLALLSINTGRDQSMVVKVRDSIGFQDVPDILVRLRLPWTVTKSNLQAW